MVTKLDYEQALATKALSERVGYPIPDWVEPIISEYVTQSLEKDILPMFAASVPTNIDTECQEHKITVGLEYTDRILTRIGISRDASLIESFGKVVSIPLATTIVDPVCDLRNKRRRWDKGFAVHFDDGKVIDEPSAQQTMVEALRHMGLERVSQYNGETFAGFRLVSRVKDERDKQARQKYADGWWIYVCMNNERKIKCLKSVAKYLGIAITIEMHNSETNPQPPSTGRRRGEGRAYFSLNGSPYLPMNRIIHLAVEQFLKQMPDATLEDLKQYFPSDLCSGLGIVASIEAIEQRMKFFTSERMRWFLDEDEILTSGDGIRFAVCRYWKSEWNGALIKHLKEQLGWTVEAAE